MKFIEFLPYIVSIITAIISGVWSYILSSNSTKNEIMKITEQHKLDLVVREKEFKHQMELKEKEFETEIKLKEKDLEMKKSFSNNEYQNKFTGEILNNFIGEAMKTEEMKNILSDAFKQNKKKNK